MDLIIPDVSRLSPLQRLRWAQAVLHQCRPPRPASRWPGSEVLRRAAQTELNLLHQLHPELFRPRPVFQDNQPPSRPA